MNFLKKNKGKIVAISAILAVFFAAYFWGGADEIAPPNTEETAQVFEEEEIKSEEKTEEIQEEIQEELPQEEPVLQAEEEKSELYCTLSVRCDTILSDISRLNPEKIDIIPKDGVLFAERKVKFQEGESVFDILLREMQDNKIHLEFVNTPVYGSVYIEGIGNIYEFDAGELSGWMYKVNGEFPNFGCSKYILKQGDKVEFVYTCDLGKDVGGEYSKGQGDYNE